MKKIEREARLFFEIFGLAALPGMLHAFIADPSLLTLPDAYFAVMTYGLYRAIVIIREDMEAENPDKDTDSRKDHDKKP